MSAPLLPKSGHVDLVMESKIQAKVNEWLKWDKNLDSNAYIKDIYEWESSPRRTKLLTELLLNRLEFGTAGLRGRMEPGYSRMNDLVIIQTTQGFAAYIESLNMVNAKERGVVIGMDGRHNSKRFAELTAGIFLARGFRVYLFSRLCPTPFVPFCVTQKHCVAGIMVTASHNPKYDNGYKVYWENGAQIIPPRDRHIQANIMDNLEPQDRAWDLDVLVNHPMLEDPYDAVCAVYFNILRESMMNLERNKASTVSITYTAMHGVGYPYMEAAFKAVNLNPMHPVLEQRDPHPDFPTVAFPNPEEKNALNLSIKSADKAGSRLILANDPDADRLAVAEKSRDGNWVIFSGNELGALLGWWIYFSYIRRHPKEDVSKFYILGSTVSSKFLQSLAKVEGFNYVETLTGFKWMGNEAFQLKAEGNTVLFAFEEAIGFMCGTTVLDKDGISAGVYVAELVTFLNTQGRYLTDQLSILYKSYGYHLSKNNYFLCNDKMKIDRVFFNLRNFRGMPNTYPSSLGGGKYPIKYVRDLTTGYDTSEPDHKARLPVSATTHMITFTFENGLVATIRTSGTEPKVKFYTEMCSAPEEGDEATLQNILDEMVGQLIEEFLQPVKNGLQYPKI